VIGGARGAMLFGEGAATTGGVAPVRGKEAATRCRRCRMHREAQAWHCIGGGALPTQSAG
jgi:hypothetical protein